MDLDGSVNPPAEAAGSKGGALEPSAAYLRLLMVLLASAAFFGDGYDPQVFALLLGTIKSAFHVSTGTIGVGHGIVVAGQFVAFFLAMQADRAGRRPLLLVTILGYTAATALSAAAWDVWSFVAFQFCAQVFIGAEFGVAVAVVVEEMPAARRGRALGVLLTIGPLGGVLAAALLEARLQDSALGWRAFYLVGIVPLLIVAVARRLLRETAYFSRDRLARAAQGAAQPVRAPAQKAWSALTRAWRHPSRRYLLGIGLVSFLLMLPAASATTWWAYYAEHERGYSSGLVGLYILSAFGLGTLGYYTCGRAMDRFGRRPVATVYILCALGCAAGLFNVAGRVAGFVLLIAAVFFGLGMGPVLSAFATEPFPTSLRAQSSAWVRNGFGNAGSVVGPAVVGLLGGAGGLVGSIGGAVSWLTLAGLPAVALVWALLPETRGLPLDALMRPRSTSDQVPS